MERRSLAPDAGMLFVFDRDEVRSFWMRRTLVPLDILFVDAEGVVVGIVAQAQPLTDTPRRVDAASRYVLELAGGWCADHSVSAGDRLDLSAIPSR